MNSFDSMGAVGDEFTVIGQRVLEIATLRGIEAGVNAAIDYLADERKNAKRSRNDRRLRNTRLLLKNYRSFRRHAEGAVYSNKSKENAIDILDGLDSDSLDDTLYVEGIKKSQQRTLIVLEHIDEMLHYYQISCEQSGRPEEVRQYNTINYLFIADERKTYQQVADMMGVDLSTVYKDVSHAIKPLSALIFGIDSLRFD